MEAVLENRLAKPSYDVRGSNQPLVSVVIPCYNHGQYLSQAIESVRRQTYIPIEIIVINDGSTDHTEEVVKQYAEIKYIAQQNLGLSSARNTGLINSKGDLIVFLDADDLLCPDAIAYNVNYLTENPDKAFVSGAYYVTTIDRQKLAEQKQVVTAKHYTAFLRNNYIGMHATVMYRRLVFDVFMFDPNLTACEDYDMYLKVSRKYPVAHHTHVLAMYRMHGANMSNNTPLMISTVLEVLGRQKQHLRSDEEKQALREGVKFYKNYYTDILYHQIRKDDIKPGREASQILRKYNFRLYFRYFLIYRLMGKTGQSLYRKFIVGEGKRILHKIGIYKNYFPGVGSINAGDFYRTTPFSKTFGYDRGGPIDRYYIENFLKSESCGIRGRILEIGDNEYTLRFGKENVQQSEILHVDGSNPNATIVGDLSGAPHIPDNSFDCIILTQTLHLVYDYKAVVATCHRILKADGILLLTVPGITPIDYGEWRDAWLWSFTDHAIKKILAESFSVDHMEVGTFGNVFAATAFLFGMGLPEVKKEMLDYVDPNIQVIITAKAVKRA